MVWAPASLLPEVWVTRVTVKVTEVIPLPSCVSKPERHFCVFVRTPSMVAPHPCVGALPGPPSSTAEVVHLAAPIGTEHRMDLVEGNIIGRSVSKDVAPVGPTLFAGTLWIFVETADIYVGPFTGEDVLEGQPPVPFPALPWMCISWPYPALEVVPTCRHDGNVALQIRRGSFGCMKSRRE